MQRALWTPALLLAACGGHTSGVAEDTQPIETRVVLRGGESAEIPGSTLRLGFVAVPADSRCAIDVVCVSAGEATVELAARDGAGFTGRVRLNLHQEPRAAEVGTYRVRLERLEPERRSGVPVALEEYRAVLGVVMLVTD